MASNEFMPTVAQRDVAADFYGHSGEAMQVAADGGNVVYAFAELSRAMGIIEPAQVAELSLRGQQIAFGADTEHFLDKIDTVLGEYDE
jgi:hypothetical protein